MMAASALLGALWRLFKGDTLRHFFPGGDDWRGTAPIASWTFVPMCAFTILPLWGALDPGKFALALIGFTAISAAFLLVGADNGGNGHPIRRFGPFGIGYWLAGKLKPAWWSKLGEPWLGGSWFGAWAAACRHLA